MTIDDALRRAVEDVYDTVLDRHRKYGPLNISNAPGGPLNGLRVRLYDKLARINNYVDHGGPADYADDSLRDAFVDAVGYGLIGLLVLDGQWPTTVAPEPEGAAVPPLFGEQWASTFADLYTKVVHEDVVACVARAEQWADEHLVDSVAFPTAEAEDERDEEPTAIWTFDYDDRASSSDTPDQWEPGTTVYLHEPQRMDDDIYGWVRGEKGWHWLDKNGDPPAYFEQTEEAYPNLARLFGAFGTGGTVYEWGDQ